LKHILDETEFLLKHYQSLEFQGLLEDEVLQRACLRSLEVIGEGVKNLSEDFKADHPEIEWRKIAGTVVSKRCVIQFIGLHVVL